MKKRQSMKIWFIDIIVIILSSLIFSLGLHCFTAPNNIAAGGVSGIAVVINSLTDIKVGLLYGLMNIPLLIIGLIFLGKKLMIKTIILIIMITVSTDYLLVNVPVYKGDMILASIFGGVFIGAGLGMAYLRECTSGGTDIINKIINKKFPHISLGKITFGSDLLVILFAVTVYRNIDVALYAIIAMFVSSKAMDLILYGPFEGKLLLIISDEYDAISKRIIDKGRGVSILKGYGAYSGKDKNVICCAAHKNEYVKIKRYVKEIDPSAFIIITSANEVLGEGFHEIQ